MVAPTDVDLLTVEELKRRFDYNPESGVFRYRCPPANTPIKIGDIAGSVREGRYLIIKIDGRAYYAHRLAWLYVYGVWPGKFVDHVDGNKLNNAIANLRPATMSSNLANRSKTAKNTSGLKGVTRYAPKKGKSEFKWKAQITFQQEVIYLGLYKTKAEAHSAYVKKAKELHGEFARF